MKKIMIILSIAIGASVLSGCGNNDDAEKQPTSNAKEAQAEIAPETPKVDHWYSMKDGYEYGYEQAVSQDQANAGQVGSTLMMFKYAGQKDGIYQVYSTDSTTGAMTVAQCSNPCDFMKVMVFFQGEHIKTERLKAQEGMVGWYVMSDAINGKLEQYVGARNGKKVHVWFDEQSGLTSTPI